MIFEITGKHGTFQVLVDDEDWERVSQYKWYVSFTRVGDYKRVERFNHRRGKIQTKIRLHRYIMNVTDSKLTVDHINGNTLDNRKCNLRVCSIKDNMRNFIKTGKTKNKTGYTGVYKTKSGKYRACVSIDNKTHHIEGNYETAEEAARARDAFVLKHFPEFGKLNFPTGGTAT